MENNIKNNNNNINFYDYGEELLNEQMILDIDYYKQHVEKEKNSIRQQNQNYQIFNCQILKFNNHWLIQNLNKINQEIDNSNAISN